MGENEEPSEVRNEVHVTIKRVDATSGVITKEVAIALKSKSDTIPQLIEMVKKNFPIDSDPVIEKKEEKHDAFR